MHQLVADRPDDHALRRQLALVEVDRTVSDHGIGAAELCSVKHDFFHAEVFQRVLHIPRRPLLLLRRAARLADRHGIRSGIHRISVLRLRLLARNQRAVVGVVLLHAVVQGFNLLRSGWHASLLEIVFGVLQKVLAADILSVSNHDAAIGLRRSGRVRTRSAFLRNALLCIAHERCGRFIRAGSVFGLRLFHGHLRLSNGTPQRLLCLFRLHGGLGRSAKHLTELTVRRVLRHRYTGELRQDGLSVLVAQPELLELLVADLLAGHHPLKDLRLFYRDRCRVAMRAECLGDRAHLGNNLAVLIHHARRRLVAQVGPCALLGLHRPQQAAVVLRRHARFGHVLRRVQLRRHILSDCSALRAFGVVQAQLNQAVIDLLVNRALPCDRTTDASRLASLGRWGQGFACEHLPATQNAADNKAARELFCSRNGVQHGVLIRNGCNRVAPVIDQILQRPLENALHDLFLALLCGAGNPGAQALFPRPKLHRKSLDTSANFDCSVANAVRQREHIGLPLAGAIGLRVLIALTGDLCKRRPVVLILRHCGRDVAHSLCGPRHFR